MNHITVAYAIAGDYEYSIISMLSLLRNANKNTFYHIAVLVDDAFGIELQWEMRECLVEYSNWDMHFYSVKDTFDNASSSFAWIKKPTFYRLLLPELLPNLKRCIYLDADTIICDDLWDMSNMSIDNYYVAGVKAPTYMIREDEKEYCAKAGLPDLQHYVNAGVLVMNLESMRSDNLVPKFLELVSQMLPSQDQDIINRVCYGRINFLPFHYNVMTKYISWDYKDYPQEFSRDELMAAWTMPTIIHYADQLKPWEDPSYPMGDYWWNVCRNSKLWDYFYKKLEDCFFEICVYRNNRYAGVFSTKKQGRLFNLKSEQKIAIYGAGERARIALNYMRECGFLPEFFVVSSKIGNEAYIDNIPVYELSEMSKDNKHTVLVIGTSERFHPEIVNVVKAYNFESIIPMSDEFYLKRERK